MINYPNVLFPGQFDYKGPVSGWFSLLHHSKLVEWSDNVRERVCYIKNKKPANEIQIRLAHIVYLDERGVDYAAKCTILAADLKTKDALLGADLKTKDALLAADLKSKDALLAADLKTKELAADLAKYNLLIADYQAKFDMMIADYDAKHDLLDASIISYIKPLIVNFVWDGSRLVFAQ